MSHAPFDTPFAHSVVDQKYMRPHGETHWNQLAARVAHHPMRALAEHTGHLFHEEEGAIRRLIEDRMFIPGGRYLYATGNDFHQVQNCLLLRAEDSREGWADMAWKSEMSLLTGAGIGAYWGDIRPGGTVVKRTGGVASGPLPKAIAVNEQGRAAVQGGDRRAAIWGGLPWFHPDVFKWITAKDWPEYIKAAKAEDPSIPAPLDMTNISVCLDDAFFYAYEGRELRARVALREQAPDWAWEDDQFSYDSSPDGGSWSEWAQKVYWACIDHMTQTGEPGFSIDLGDKWNEKLRNACTEITSEDDSDICNLGGLVISRFDSPEQFGEAVRLGALFLTAGTVYSHVPYDKVAETRDKNRRLGLDLMGIHEFCLQRGLAYGSDDAFEALEPYMAEYDRALEYAWDWQDDANLSRSVAATAGSPTGTRGLAAETSTSWEPIPFVAYKRTVVTSRAHERDERTTTYVIDPVIARLTREGYIRQGDPVEDAHSLAHDGLERRLQMQAYAQSHTDHAISMTINLPHVMKDSQERRSFGELLYRYLPQLRGITVYPNGAIAGQPIEPVSFEEAAAATGVVLERPEEACTTGACGI